MDNFNELLKIQNQIRAGLKREEAMDNKIKVLSIINELTSGPKETMQKELLIIETNNRGISEQDVEKILIQLEKDNVIFEPSPGHIKKR
jgi:DNA replicative helicase MCM subunit Mcm2 (Cdc46/Mcm family)